MSAVRLSILVPNFNNGRASSKSGRRDFIDDLFTSLWETLAGDPTPLEIIVADDGSTDDSPATCRRWAGRTWRGGQPFCRLLEARHCGVLSVVANRLTAEAAGELCCRLDGDVVVHTRDWAAALCRGFDDAPPGLGVVGAKQLGYDGRVHAAGDWVLHPRGYHHVAAGASRDAITRTMEVDHVMGCFYAYRRVVWEQLGGYDESIGRGQTVDFSLRARLKGWRVVSVPDIEFTHHHSQRRRRQNRGDTGAGITESLARFREKWGFDRLAPDLDDVTRRWGRTPLAWNAAVFGPSATWPRPTGGPIEFKDSEWVRFTRDETFRRAVLWRAAVVEAVVADAGPRKRIGHLGCRSGLLCHVLARRGMVCVGADADVNHVELARSVVAGKPYPEQAPVFEVQRDPQYRTLSFETGSLDMLLLFDVVEHHRNPVGLYREAKRVLEPGGVLVIVTQRHGPEVRQQLESSGHFDLLCLSIEAPATGLTALAARRREPAASAIEPRPATGARRVAIDAV